MLLLPFIILLYDLPTIIVYLGFYDYKNTPKLNIRKQSIFMLMYFNGSAIQKEGMACLCSTMSAALVGRLKAFVLK
jgi:hypothetical protein